MPSTVFLPPTPLQLCTRTNLRCTTAISTRASHSASSPDKALVPRDTYYAPNVSRRTLLTNAAALALSVALPSSPASAEHRAVKVIERDFLYDSTSGSFLPPSALPTILQSRRSGRLFDRCVVAAEVHDNACTHAAQLATLNALRSLGDDRPLIVGFEQFYREHDPLLDSFVAGDISLGDLLIRAEWQSTWGFDPHLYAPLFLTCRKYGITMRGLNAPLDLTSRVASVGIQGLTPHERAALPIDMDMSNSEHFSFFRRAMEGAHAVDNPTLARFYQVQVLWEEWMSESVSRALARDSSARMLVFVGCGHVENRFGLPDRIQRRSNERPFTILPVPVNWTAAEDTPLQMPDITLPARDAADLVWYTRFDDS